MLVLLLRGRVGMYVESMRLGWLRRMKKTRHERFSVVGTCILIIR